MIKNLKLILLSVIDVITSVLALVMTIIFCWLPSKTKMGTAIRQWIEYLKELGTRFEEDEEE